MLEDLGETIQNVGLAQSIQNGLPNSQSAVPNWPDPDTLAAKKAALTAMEPWSEFQQPLCRFLMEAWAETSRVSLVTAADRRTSSTQLGSRLGARNAGPVVHAEAPTEAGVTARWPAFCESREFALLARYKCLEDSTLAEPVGEKTFHDMRPLGKGAFGLVSLVFKKDTGCAFATKKFNKLVAKEKRMLHDVLVEHRVRRAATVAQYVYALAVRTCTLSQYVRVRPRSTYVYALALAVRTCCMLPQRWVSFLSRCAWPSPRHGSMYRSALLTTSLGKASGRTPREARSQQRKPRASGADPHPNLHPNLHPHPHAKPRPTRRQVLLKLRSPFCVSLHYAWQDQDNLAMVLTLCPGGDLSFMLKHRYHNPDAKDRKARGRFSPLPEGAVRFYAASIALGLQAIKSNSNPVAPREATEEAPKKHGMCTARGN